VKSAVRSDESDKVTFLSLNILLYLGTSGSIAGTKNSQALALHPLSHYSSSLFSASKHGEFIRTYDLLFQTI